MSSNVLKTRRRYDFVGGDFSAQEVKVFAACSQDENMIKTYLEGKDLYSDVASKVYNVPYEQCLEFSPTTGEMQPEGKKRRTSCKSLILGIMYGRGVVSVAEQIKSHDGDVTKEDIKEAKKLINDFFAMYPTAKEWIDGTHEKARKQGYVEDLWGRRRRLPDINLPRYEFTKKNISNNRNTLFNPLLNSDTFDNKVSDEIISKYTKLLDNARSVEERKKICDAAELSDNIIIKNNSGFIAEAERQSVNSIIQGSSATMTKLAMRNIDRDPIMKEIDFHLLIPVHDEIIGECPKYYAERGKKRLAELMMEAGKPECSIPMKVDGDNWSRWYIDVFSAHIHEEFENMLKSGKTKEEALKYIIEENEEFLPSEIGEILGNLLL